MLKQVEHLRSEAGTHRIVYGDIVIVGLSEEQAHGIMALLERFGEEWSAQIDQVLDRIEAAMNPK